MGHQKYLLAAGLLLSLTAINAEASLTVYTAAGNQSVVYSSVSNITWTGDANLLGTLEASNPNLVNTIIGRVGSIADTPNGLDTPAKSGIHTLSAADFGTNGLASWFGAKAFTSYLNTINYADSNQWALPSAGANPQIGWNPISQLGQLFYNELGGTAKKNIPNTANFTNEQIYANYYWLDTEIAYNPYRAYDFGTHNGFQNSNGKDVLLYAWAVSPGQVARRAGARRCLVDG